MVVPGTPASAPTSPRLLRIVAVTTLVSCVLFAVFCLAVRYYPFDLQALGRAAK